MRSSIALLVVLLAGGSVAVAQETSGNVRGRLRSASGGAVVSARVTATSPDLLGVRQAVSASDGVFTLLALPPGSYTLRVAAIGYRPTVIQAVPVQLGRTTGLGEIQLEPAAVQLGEITITAPRVTLDPVRTTIGATLEAADFAALPAERDYKSLIAILPHVNKSTRGDPVNVAGATGLENMYFIDGVNVTSELKAESGTSLPYNFVRAIEVKTGGYEAQYGRALGAVVNAVTYSGTNDFEVSLFGFATHSAMSATPKVVPTLRESGALSFDVGLRVGGPVVRERLWYSAAYNPRVERLDREILSQGTFTDERTTHSFAGKLTWQANPETNLELSLFGDPTVQDAVTVPIGVPAGYTPLNPDPYLRRLETGGVVGSLRVSRKLGDRLLLETSLARSTGRDNLKSPTELGRTQPFVIDDVSRTVSGGTQFVSISDLQRSAAVLRATLTRGRHTAILGAEYEDVAVFRNLEEPGGYHIRRGAAGFITIAEQATGRLHNRVPTLYLQDSWRVTDRLTLNAGVRWSSQTLTAASGGVAQRFADEWQPRLGVIWQPSVSGRQRAFASFGRFYQQEPLNLSTLWYLDYPFVVSSYSTDPRQPGAIPDRVDDFSTREVDWAKSIPGLAVENSDEFTLGYERLVGSDTRLTVRVLRRELRSSFQWGINPSDPAFWILGTPGKGTFDFLPKPVREYTALELGAAGQWQDVDYRASYVLSRNWGNRTGLYLSDIGFANPGAQNTLFAPHQAVNSTGLLPNDRTHVFKLAASRIWGFGLLGGFSFTWASGTPMNEFAPGPPGAFYPNYAFVVPRGSAGRTAYLWDLDLRFAYDLKRQRGGNWRILLDLLHVGNPQRVTWREELAYLGNDGEMFLNPNPSYGQPIAYQPPMRARLGVEVAF